MLYFAFDGGVCCRFQEDLPGNSTDLLLALDEMQRLVLDCESDYVTVFFLTDGGDNVQRPGKAPFEYLWKEKLEKLMQVKTALRGDAAKDDEGKAEKVSDE